MYACSCTNERDSRYLRAVKRSDIHVPLLVCFRDYYQYVNLMTVCNYITALQCIEEDRLQLLALSSVIGAL